MRDHMSRDTADLSAVPKSLPPGSSWHTLLLYTTPRRDDIALVAWIGAALERGDKVLCKHAPDAEAALHRMLESQMLTQATRGIDVLDSGQLELVDAGAMGARCGGRHVQLSELHAELCEQAQREGYAGLATTADGPAMRALTRDREELLAHERDIERIAGQGFLHALCRLHPSSERSVLADELEIHYRDVDDDIWTATIENDQLWIRGELDLSNASRLTRVLHAGLAGGLSVVNLADLEFCAVAGVRAFLEAADALTGGRELVLTGMTPPVARAFTMTGGADHPGLRLVSQERGR